MDKSTGTKKPGTKKPRSREQAASSIDAVSIEFVLKLGRALHTYGTPAHRLEEALGQLSARLGLEAQFFSTPTSIMAAFGALGHQQTSLIRVEPGEVDLGKMARLDEVTGQVIRGELVPSKGLRRIDEIVADRPLYNNVVGVIGYAVASGAASTFFGGQAREMAVSVVIGALIGILSQAALRWATLKRVFVAVSALMSSLIAVLAGAVVAPLSVYVPTVAGLIILLPGLTLTVAMTELATLNLVSGASRLTHALIIFLQMAFGVAVGLHLGELAVGVVQNQAATPLPFWSQWIALVVASVAFGVLFRARPRDMGWMLLSAALAFGGARLGTLWLGVELGAFVGALLVGMASNVYARVFDRPSAMLMVPGIVMLVPGSIGFRSVSYLLERDVVTGIETAFTMTLVAAALVAGLLLSNLIVPPRKAL
ncbi:MAG: threonine/serine exporter family protein [Bradymonadaceae bacterium]|nr:threonine/serine exporter family protein [Lujinxingiaceae bacterium]